MLVTGASGRLGGRLLPLLRERGWRIRALVHRHAPAAAADESIQGDLLDRESLGRATRDVDAVVHLAAVTHARSRGAYDRVNVEGTCSILGAAADAGAPRFLHVSTRAVAPEGGWYSASKHRAEELVRATELPWSIVRLPEVYGAGGGEGVDLVIDAVRRGRRVPMVGAGEHELCPVHVDDILPALAAALEAPEAIGKTYTLGGECLSFRQVVEACAFAFGERARYLRIPAAAVALAASAARVLPLPLYPDQPARLAAPKPALSTDAADELGFLPRSLADGLRASGGAR